MNVSTTVQYNKLEVILLNIISDITLLIYVMFQKSKRKPEQFNLFYKESNPVHGSGTCVSVCVYM